MQSPFAIFRKHQRAGMVVLTLMAMFAFVFLDTFNKGTNTGGGRDEVWAVETRVGGLTEIELQGLIEQRTRANRFVQAAFYQSHPEFANTDPRLLAMFGGKDIQQYVFGFGLPRAREALLSHLLREEGRRLGVVVSDAQIEDFFDEITDKKLSASQFNDILKTQLRVSSRQLYDIIREELLAKRTFLMMRPANPPSPEVLWQYYRQLHVRQKIEVAAVPVKAFVDKVAAPSDAELTAFFGKHREDFPTYEDGEWKPGFRQAHRARLHYVKSSYEETEKKVLAANPVTDEEVEAYYEKNKDARYKINIIPQDLEQEGKPGDDRRPPPPTMPDEIRRLPAPVTDEVKPQTEEKPAEKKEEEEPAKPSTPAKEPEKKEEVKKEEEAKKPGTECQEAKDETKPQATEKDAAEKPTAEKPSETKPDTTEIVEPETPSYKPLTEELRDQIREDLLRERTQKVMRDDANKVVLALSGVGLKLATEFPADKRTPEALKAIAEKSQAALEGIGNKYIMEFGATGLVTPQEFFELPGIGKAQEPGEDPVANPVTLHQNIYSNDIVFTPYRGEDPSSRDLYVAWKIENVAEHAPKSLTEPGIKDQVLEAWKIEQAKPKANKRAEELAKLAREANKPLAEVFGEQTVTGDKDGLQLTVHETPQFSWLRESSARSMSPFNPSPPPTLSEPAFIDKPGEKFMEAVFDQLEPLETGVAQNADASVFYVVRVLERQPHFDVAREMFMSTTLYGRDMSGFPMPTPYDQLREQAEILANSRFVRQLETQYAVKWNKESDVVTSRYED